MDKMILYRLVLNILLILFTAVQLSNKAMKKRLEDRG